MISVQVQYKAMNSPEGGLKELDVEFTSNLKNVETKTINQYYDSSLEIYVKHFQLHTKDNDQTIDIELLNQSISPISELSIYLSSNFTILDLNKPLFYYLTSTEETMLYGIFFPVQEQKLYISISSTNGDVVAKGSFQRDSALNGKFDFTSQGEYRKYFDVNAKDYQFFIQIKALFPYSQGQIVVSAYPFNQELPLNMISLPQISQRSIKLEKQINQDENNKEITNLLISYYPLSCTNPEKRLNPFELVSIQYSVIFSHNQQLSKALDTFIPQIEGDFSEIKTTFDIFQQGKTETTINKNNLLFFNTDDKQECYNDCSPCGQKNLIVPLDNIDVDQFFKEKKDTFIVVRAIANWKMEDSQHKFSQTFYYNHENLDLNNLPHQPRIVYLVIMLAVIGIIGLVLVGIACFYFFKYKKSEKILSYELTDVRNVAHLETKDKNFNHVPLENEESSSEQL